MKQSKRVIGLTGTIASGKSTTAAYFSEKFGIPVIDADKVGHDVLRDKKIIDKITAVFGKDICGADGEIDRARLGKAVFADEEKRQRLNAITHPAICDRIRRQIRQEQEREDGRPFLMVEAIELLRSELKDMADEVWVVYADPAVRQQRMMAERGLTQEAASARIESQWDDTTYRNRADRVFNGNGTKEELWRQCDRAYTETTGNP